MATDSSQVTKDAIPVNGLDRFFVVEKTFTAPAVPVSTDIIQCLQIPANCLVMQVQSEIVTPATGDALTLNVGITGDDPNGFDNAVDMTAVAGTITQGKPGTDAYLTAGGKDIAASDTIDIAWATVTNITAGGSFILRAFCARHD